MARNYDRLIRYYDSWFDDLRDQDKQLSPAECWQVILAIRDAQQMSSVEPIRNLPLAIRRALSMSTLCEQVLRIIERCDNLRERGRKGGRSTARLAATVAEHPSVDIKSLTPPSDGVDRNFSGMVEQLKSWRVDDYVIYQALTASNYGQIGSKIWHLIARCRNAQHPGDYFTTCMSNLS